MRHNVYTFFSHYNCLDEEFDAPDIASDRELCQAIVAGRAGLHPDAWGSHDPLTMPSPRFRRPFVPPVGYPGDHSVEWKPHKPTPVERQARREVERQIPPLARWKIDRPAPPPSGEIKLTCDDCDAEFHQTANYGAGRRDAAAAMLRQMGHIEGWTHIVGRDRCPACSFIPPAPLDVDQRRVV